LSSFDTAFLFPAFAADYREYEGPAIPGYRELFASMLAVASEKADPELMAFDPAGNTFLSQSLLNQYLSYTQSLTCSLLLRRNHIVPDILACYSMGIYAGLADAGVFSFETGLEIIREAHREIARVVAGRKFAMGAVIGLDAHDIGDLIRRNGPGLGISIRNGEFSYVVTGPQNNLSGFLASAREEGAIHTNLLNTETPYHSEYLEATRPAFSAYVEGLSFGKPTLPVISPVDQSILTTPAEMKEEVVRNLFSPFDWYLTNKRLCELGTRRLIESAPLRSLVRMARFYPLDLTYLSPSEALRES
jgi:[acyl-carrier-protein] S-malonyltransferase